MNAFVDESFKLKDWLLGKVDNKVSKDQDASMLNDLILYIMLAAIALIGLLGMLIVRIFKKYREKIMTKLRSIKDKFIWNGTIRSILIAYVKLIITVGIQIEMWLRNSKYQQTTDILVAMMITSFVVAFPVFIFVFNSKNRQRLDLPEVKAKWSNFYSELHLTRTSWTVFYLPMFLIRRIFFVMIPTFMFLHPMFQLQFLVFSSSLYVIFYESQKPHLLKSRQQLEVTNEVLIMIACYHMFLFSKFNFNLDLQFTMGYSLVAVIGILVAINIAVMTYKGVQRYKSKKRKQANK